VGIIDSINSGFLDDGPLPEQINDVQTSVVVVPEAPAGIVSSPKWAPFLWYINRNQQTIQKHLSTDNSTSSSTANASLISDGLHSVQNIGSLKIVDTTATTQTQIDHHHKNRQQQQQHQSHQPPQSAEGVGEKDEKNHKNVPPHMLLSHELGKQPQFMEFLAKGLDDLDSEMKNKPPYKYWLRRTNKHGHTNITKV
jgi:hypothetical protein